MSEGGATAPPRVLVIEDEEDLATLVRLNLDIAGYEVEVARNGAEGLERIRDDAPDVVLLDVMMPVMDGWQVLRAVKEDEELRDLPVIMLTALGEERDLIRGHLQGAVRYVVKPFDMDTLLGAVAEALEEPSDEEREQRRQRVRHLLRRLAELDSGREATGQVRLTRLESPPGSKPTSGLAPGERDRVDELTDKQRYLAEQLAAGRSARDLADELDVSRSNVYATRKRVARKLGVPPADVADEARRLGLSEDEG